MRPTGEELNDFMLEQKFENINRGIGRASIDSGSPNVSIIKKNVNMVEYYNDVIVPLAPIFKPMSARAGICPFHKDTDPSFHAHLANEYYHCFGCGYTGSIIAVHRQIRYNYDKIKLTEEEAIQELANRYGIKILEIVQTTDKHEDMFAMAAKMLLDPNYKKDYTGDLTVSSFKRNNRRLLEMPITEKQKLANLAELDLQIAAYLTGGD